MSQHAIQNPKSAIQNRAGWICCWLMFLATALSFLDRQVLSILAPDLMREFGMSNTTYSYVLAAFTCTYTVMFSVGGWFMDRIGTRWGIALALGIWSAASAAHGLIGGVCGLVIARAFLGLGEGGCFPAATKGACEWVGPAKRALAIGIANGGSAFGAVIAPPLTAGLVSHFGWRGAFYATGLMGMAWVIGWLLIPQPTPPVAVSKSTSTVTSPHWMELLKDRQVWRILASRFCFDPVFYFYMFWIPQYLSRDRGYSMEQIGNSLWIPFLALGISNIAAGQISDRLIRRGWSAQQARVRLLTVAALLTTVSGLVVFAPSAYWALGLMSVLMIAHGLWICNFLAYASDRFPPMVIGTVIGLSGTAGGVASTLSNLLVGKVVDHYSFLPVFAVSAILYPLALVVLLTKSRPTDPHKVPKQDFTAATR